MIKPRQVARGLIGKFFNFPMTTISTRNPLELRNLYQRAPVFNIYRWLCNDKAQQTENPIMLLIVTRC